MPIPQTRGTGWSAVLAKFRCILPRSPARRCWTKNVPLEMRLLERCHLKNGVCEGGNRSQAGLPWQTCPLRRVIFPHQAHESRQIEYRELPKAMQVAALRPNVPNIIQFSAFTD